MEQMLKNDWSRRPHNRQRRSPTARIITGSLLSEPTVAITVDAKSSPNFVLRLSQGMKISFLSPGLPADKFWVYHLYVDDTGIERWELCALFGEPDPLDQGYLTGNQLTVSATALSGRYILSRRGPATFEPMTDPDDGEIRVGTP